MGKMFELLKEGLEEAIEFHKGNVKLRTKEVFIPDSPKNYRAEDIKKIEEETAGCIRQGCFRNA